MKDNKTELRGNLFPRVQKVLVSGGADVSFLLKKSGVVFRLKILAVHFTEMDSCSSKTYLGHVVRFKWTLASIVQTFFQCRDLARRLGGIVGELLAHAGISISGSELDERGLPHDRVPQKVLDRVVRAPMLDT